jgi:hypothetical protein
MAKKVLVRALLSICGFLFVVLISLRTLGYEPQDTNPGLWISGNIVSESVVDWSFTNEIDEIFVETRTPYLVPHSITT